MKLSIRHPLFTTVSEVNQTCKTLCLELNLSFFSYGRFYDDGFCYLLTNRPESYEFFLSQEMQLTVSVPGKFVKKEFFYSILNDGYYKEAINYFGIFYPFDYIVREQGYYDMLCIGSYKDDAEVINHYLNNLSMLKQFFRDFIKLLEKPLKIHADNKFLLPKHMQTNFKGLEKNELKEAVVQIDRYIAKKYNLSFRESQVLSFVMQGYTAKSIGLKLKLGSRTIESHIEKIKLKVNCYSKSDLIDKITYK